jgi:hypothetical protein
LMFGLAASKPAIALAVCMPSVPSPDSANVIVWLLLAETELVELELLQAAVTAARLAATAMTPTRQRLDLPVLTLVVEPIKDSFLVLGTLGNCCRKLRSSNPCDPRVVTRV